MTVEQLYDASKDQPIVLYDGVCNLCNGFVNFVLRTDKEGIIKFCALQEKGGLALRHHLNMGTEIGTAIGLWKGQIFTHSDVLRMVASSLKGWWSLVLPLYVLPKSFRDWVYMLIAKNRYRLFGKRDTCMVPNNEVLSRFICNR